MTLLPLRRSPMSGATASKSRPALEVSGAFTPRPIICTTVVIFFAGISRSSGSGNVSQRGPKRRHR